MPVFRVVSPRVLNAYFCKFKPRLRMTDPTNDAKTPIQKSGTFGSPAQLLNSVLFVLEFIIGELDAAASLLLRRFLGSNGVRREGGFYILIPSMKVRLPTLARLEKQQF